MTSFGYTMLLRWGGNLSNRKYDKSRERALSDYCLHKYILEKCPKKIPISFKGIFEEHCVHKYKCKISWKGQEGNVIWIGFPRKGNSFSCFNPSDI